MSPKRSSSAAVAALLFLTAACTNSDTSLLGPSGSRCGVTLTNSLETAPPSGASGTLTVTTARDCRWAASSGASWIVLTSSSNGQGDGAIEYRVAANQNPAARDAVIEVNDSRATIAQGSAECRFALTGGSPIAADGGTTTVRVEPTANCGWTAASDGDWLRVVSGASGTGGGTVTLAAEPNAGGVRSATVSIAGESITVVQQSGLAPAPPAPGCSYAILPTGQTMGSGGGSGTIAVTAGTACGWTAATNVDWMVITEGATGNGNGTVRFQVSTNAGASRTGTLTVAGQVFTVTQGSVACNYAIAPGSDTIAAGGGTSVVTVTAGGACAWSAASNAAWIKVVAGASGTGNGTVRLEISANTGPARTGTATIAGQTFSVTQTVAPCNYTLNPATLNVTADGGGHSTQVATAPGCAWGASSNETWITLTSAPSGVGNGVVSFNVAPNAGPARGGTLTIGGQTLTISQAPVPCAFALSAPSYHAAAGGGGSTVAVTSGAGCPQWAAVSNNLDWLTVTDGAAGIGNGVVTFAVAANGGPARSGTLTIGGQPFTVTQDAPCAFSLSAPGYHAAGAGDAGSFTVTTGPACSWTPVSNNPDWLMVTPGASVTGSGPVQFTVGANPGPPRIGTITVAGQTFTVEQAAP